MTISELFDHSDQYWDELWDELSDGIDKEDDMMNPPSFSSLHDARTWYLNSGLIDWDWFDEFDEQDLVDYLYRNADGIWTLRVLLWKYLLDHGQDPANYSI